MFLSLFLFWSYGVMVYIFFKPLQSNGCKIQLQFFTLLALFHVTFQCCLNMGSITFWLLDSEQRHATYFNQSNISKSIRELKYASAFSWSLQSHEEMPNLPDWKLYVLVIPAEASLDQPTATQLPDHQMILAKSSRNFQPTIPGLWVVGAYCHMQLRICGRFIALHNVRYLTQNLRIQYKYYLFLVKT